MAYGFQQLDAAGNVLVDSSLGTSLIHQVITEETITLYPLVSAGGSSWGASYPNTAFIYVLGCNSANDFSNNYITLRDPLSGTYDWGWPSTSRDHTFTFYLYTGNAAATPEASRNLGLFIVQWNGVYPTNNNGAFANTTEASNAKETQTWNIYSVGKTLSQ